MSTANSVAPVQANDNSNVLGNAIRRIIQLTHEIEQTYGYGKSYRCFLAPLDGYSQREWEEKKRRDQEWAETTFKWNNERRPLLAELRTLASLHRAEFPELAELVENSQWERELPKELIWGRIRCVALEAAEKEKPSSGAPTSQAHSRVWEPPSGYVGRKTICKVDRFKKMGKNPVPTTIDAWVNRAKKTSSPIAVVKDPANGENYYPESWIFEQIVTWKPRKSAT